MFIGLLAVRTLFIVSDVSYDFSKSHKNVRIISIKMSKIFFSLLLVFHFFSNSKNEYVYQQLRRKICRVAAPLGQSRFLNSLDPYSLTGHQKAYNSTILAPKRLSGTVQYALNLSSHSGFHSTRTPFIDKF